MDCRGFSISCLRYFALDFIALYCNKAIMRISYAEYINNWEEYKSIKPSRTFKILLADLKLLFQNLYWVACDLYYLVKQICRKLYLKLKLSLLSVESSESQHESISYTDYQPMQPVEEMYRPAFKD